MMYPQKRPQHKDFKYVEGFDHSGLIHNDTGEPAPEMVMELSKMLLDVQFLIMGYIDDEEPGEDLERRLKALQKQCAFAAEAICLK